MTCLHGSDLFPGPPQFDLVQKILEKMSERCGRDQWTKQCTKLLRQEMHRSLSECLLMNCRSFMSGAETIGLYWIILHIYHMSYSIYNIVALGPVTRCNFNFKLQLRSMQVFLLCAFWGHSRIDGSKRCLPESFEKPGPWSLAKPSLGRSSSRRMVLPMWWFSQGLALWATFTNIQGLYADGRLQRFVIDEAQLDPSFTEFHCFWMKSWSVARFVPSNSTTLHQGIA